jgi:hypothetical protein
MGVDQQKVVFYVCLCVLKSESSGESSKSGKIFKPMKYQDDASDKS